MYVIQPVSTRQFAESLSHELICLKFPNFACHLFTTCKNVPFPSPPPHVPLHAPLPNLLLVLLSRRKSNTVLPGRSSQRHLSRWSLPPSPPPSFSRFPKPSKGLILGHFRAEEWNSETNQYGINSNMGLKITVDVCYNCFGLLILRKHLIMIIE